MNGTLSNLKLDDVEHLIPLTMAIDIMILRIQVDHFVILNIEKVLYYTQVYSKTSLIKKSGELIQFSILTNDCENEANSKDNKNKLNSSNSYSHFKFSPLKVDYLDKSCLINLFHVYLIDCILNKQEIAKITNQEDLVIIEGPSSKYLKCVDKICNWFNLGFKDLKTILIKFFNANDALKNKLELLKNSSHISDVNSLQKSYENNKNLNDQSGKNNLINKFSIWEKLPETAIVELDRWKLMEFINFDFSFVINAEDFITSSMSNLETIEKQILKLIENSFVYNNLESEYSIKYNQIKPIISYILPDNQVKVVEEEILKHSKTLSSRNFFTKVEFTKLVFSSKYLLKLFLESSQFYKSNIEEKYKELGIKYI